MPEQDKANPFLAAVIAAGAENIVEVWPENWQAFALFCRLETQWQSGFNGPVGLRYEALYPLLDREAATPDEWDNLFDDVREIEAGALRAINDKE